MNFLSVLLVSMLGSIIGVTLFVIFIMILIKIFIFYDNKDFEESSVGCEDEIKCSVKKRKVKKK
jgi:hypothetical protein